MSTTLEPKYSKVKVLGQGSFGVVYLVKEQLSSSRSSRGISPSRAISPSSVTVLRHRSQSSQPRGVSRSGAQTGAGTSVAVDGSRLFVAKELRIATNSRGHSNTAAMVMKEVNVLAKLSHPNIVQYVEHIQETDRAYIIMEYCDGGELKEFLKERLTRGLYLSEKEVVSIMTQLLSAAEYIHSQHLIHRDLKSANIFMTRRGKVKFGDFGLTKQADATAAAAHTICGTPMYYSPELCVKAKYDAKTDIWALGCVMFELMNLYHPFRDLSVKQVFEKVRALDYPDPNPGGRYSRELGEAITKYMMCPVEKRLTAAQLRQLPIFGGTGLEMSRTEPRAAALMSSGKAQTSKPSGPYDTAAAQKILALLDQSQEDPAAIAAARDALNSARSMSFQDRCVAAEAVVRALGSLATQDAFVTACAAMGMGGSTTARPK